MCTDATRAVLAEFPAYGTVTLDVGDGAEGGCFASFTAADPPSSVLAYYRRQLTRHRWTVETSGLAPATTGGAPASSIPTSVPAQAATEVGIAATRDGYAYEVDTEPGEGSSGTYVAINVSWRTR